jgi:hypothetical protein
MGDTRKRVEHTPIKMKATTTLNRVMKDASAVNCTVRSWFHNTREASGTLTAKPMHWPRDKHETEGWGLDTSGIDCMYCCALQTVP